jgi:hypothetical protein
VVPGGVDIATAAPNVSSCSPCKFTTQQAVGGKAFWLESRSAREPSYVDGPYWQAFFDVSNDLVCFGHMSGLLVRVYDRWP